MGGSETGVNDERGDDARYWRELLESSGGTRLPRWSANATASVEDRPVVVDGAVEAGVQLLAKQLEVPVSSVVLAAHVVVLSALSCDADVVVGYVPSDASRVRPCRLVTGVESWRSLILAADRTQTELLSRDTAALADAVAELRLAAPPYETAVDLSGARELADGVVLAVAIPGPDDLTGLVVRGRGDVVDIDAVERIAGYHAAALAQVAEDPDATPERGALLSADELRLQLEGFAGPRCELPDRRAHELFEQQAARRPDMVAAVHGGRQWTYGELDARANRLARALRTRGLQREGVVAVVCDRGLDWMAAVLATLKAGGVYLPIEPHFPADRIVRMLSRADCRLALATREVSRTLDAALAQSAGVANVVIESAYDEGHADTALGVEVDPDQLAYIYFTSGSTGEPKGAMCEHAGMLNHLLAKIEDLEIGEGSVVAQTAPQCFDISLWQLLSAVLVGGRTVIVDQSAILDVESFVDELASRRVSVAQVVPSYLEVVLSYLQSRPRPLADLRYVSVTGEALKKELLPRWFDVMPDVRLVNAYGLTETSDDTNHEVMHRPPEGDRVPLGRPVRNVRAYVLDEQLAPVPLGAPGVICFSGVCVGRGYVNDSERTGEVYLDDPYSSGSRLYWSGDYGRWRPDGKLEFLGRRDAQVKVAGFRIEIGEVEGAMLRAPGVRDGAVVVAGADDRSRRLVAFYRGDRPLDPQALRERLGESLPSYMVPSALHWREALPLTANGKIDRRALASLAAQLAEDERDEGSADAPVTASEQRLAAAWAAVLGVPEDKVRRSDHFFDRGGTSLAAVKLAIAMDRAVSLKDITRHPVLADLAGLLDGGSEPAPGLLQALWTPARPAARALVCFPYAGGNAVNFEPMARELHDSGLAVYAVELPGHDVSADVQPFASVDDVVAAAVDEVIGRGIGEAMLWGHSSGAVLAVETARALERRGVEVRAVFVAAQLLGTSAERRGALQRLGVRDDAEIAAELSALGAYTDLGQLDSARAQLVAAAYRHDVATAHERLADIAESGSPHRLRAPLTVVVAADDPITDGAADRHHEWEAVAEHVDLCEIAGGGHYFAQSRPAAAASVVRRAAALLESR
jgi:amino acid adenylation domain-containing protein